MVRRKATAQRVPSRCVGLPLASQPAAIAKESQQYIIPSLGTRLGKRTMCLKFKLKKIIIKKGVRNEVG